MSATFRAASTAALTANATSITVHAPTGVVQGDVLIAWICAPGADGPVTTPPGWTLLNAAGDYNTAYLAWWFYKVAGASEPSSYTFDSYSNIAYSAVILDYYDCALDALAIAASPTPPTGPYNNYTPANIVTTQPNELVVTFWTAWQPSTAQTITLPSGLTSRANLSSLTGTTPASSALAVGDFLGPSSPGVAIPYAATNSANPYWASGTISLKSTTPQAPVLIAPANGTYMDVAATGGPFKWEGYTGLGSLLFIQTAYHFASSTSGGAQSYWNAGTSSFQSTDVANNSSSMSLTFPVDSWPDSVTYNWTVAVADNNGTGPYAGTFTLNAQAGPTVTVTSPTGNEDSQTPPIVWTPNLAYGATQGSYRVITYDATQYGASGFTPGVGPSVDDSGTVYSGSSTYTVQTSLTPDVAYRSYVTVAQSPGTQTAPYAYCAYTVVTDVPATPSVVAVYETDPSTGCPRIAITVTAADNLLTAVDSSFETGTGSYVGTNATLAQSSTEAEDGLYSLEMTATAAGNMSAVSSYGNYAVVPGETYTGMASFYPAATARTVSVALSWYTSGDVLISTVTGAGVAETLSTWTKAVCTAAAPATAAYVALTVNVASAAASEIHYVDEAGVIPGSNPPWSLGGYVGSSSATILRSDGAYVRYASTANPAAIGEPSQTVTVYDYEATPTTSYTYTANVVSVGLTSLSSGASNAVQVPAALGFWELDPTNYASATNAQPTAWNPQTYEQSAVHPVLSQTTQNVVASAMQVADFSATFEIFTVEIYNAFTALSLGQKTVFISDPFGASYYFRIAPEPGGLSMGIGNLAHNTTLKASTATAPYRSLAVTGIGQPRPAV